jgi:hypothetical protein
MRSEEICFIPKADGGLSFPKRTSSLDRIKQVYCPSWYDLMLLFCVSGDVLESRIHPHQNAGLSNPRHKTFQEECRALECGIPKLVVLLHSLIYPHFVSFDFSLITLYVSMNYIYKLINSRLCLSEYGESIRFKNIHQPSPWTRKSLR